MLHCLGIVGIACASGGAVSRPVTDVPVIACAFMGRGGQDISAVWEVYLSQVASLLEEVNQKQLKECWVLLMVLQLAEVDSCCTAWMPGLFVGQLMVVMDCRRSLHIGSLLLGQWNNVSEDLKLSFTLPSNVPSLFTMPVDYKVSKL